jgi:hypothetical protein
MTNLIVAFRYFANAPKNRTLKCRGLRLRTGRARVSNPGTDKILFSSKKKSRSALQPKQPPNQCVPGFVPGAKAAEA